jgi:glycosyltransferase involved in cell wall biosynthesis/predicted O-methyltransferase YrrM
MNKVAIVVQRCHESIVGGSESLAWHYATVLSEAYDVDVLTTTALDTGDWANALPEGAVKKDRVNILRFPVTLGRSVYWGELHQRLLAGFNPFTAGRHRNSDSPFKLQWNVPLQEEFIRNQGPYSEPLMQFIKQKAPEYQATIFVTYLYPTTYFGLQQVPSGQALFVPTLHDEQPAYLSAYKYAARRARELLWLTAAEQRVGYKLWGDLRGRIVAMAVDTKLREPAEDPGPYLLYCGRVDPNKGCPQLFEYFLKFKRDYRSKIRLIITGKDDMEIPVHPDIDFQGLVSPEEKFRLMAGATLYVMPSGNESFSIVTLEAMAQRTPVLASGVSEVLVDHIRRSGAGRIYSDYQSFASSLNEMLSNNAELARMGAAGRKYVLSHYHGGQTRDALIKAVESCVQPTPRVATALKSARWTCEEFNLRLAKNVETCSWETHPSYSVFTQYDKDYYLHRNEDFIHKYRCFYAVSKTISPRSIIELGTSGGGGADAYLSAAPDAKYTGIDIFDETIRNDNHLPWNPYEVAKLLLEDRRFKNWELIKADLRQLDRLPSRADLVVVDAAHDFDNAYADLKLALTANPTFIFVDDADDENAAKPAIDEFIQEELANRVEYTAYLPYTGGGLVIKLRE